jgi:hypothetical protein
MTTNTASQSIPLRVGLVVMCRIVGMSKPSFRARVNAGDFPQAVDGKYDVPRSVKAWHEWKTASGDNPRRVFEEQRAIKLRRENAKAAGALTPTSEVEFMIDHACAVFNLNLEAMPGRVAPIAAMKEAPVIEQIVRVECERCRTQIREAFEAFAAKVNELDQSEGANAND